MSWKEALKNSNNINWLYFLSDGDDNDDDGDENNDNNDDDDDDENNDNNDDDDDDDDDNNDNNNDYEDDDDDNNDNNDDDDDDDDLTWQRQGVTCGFFSGSASARGKDAERPFKLSQWCWKYYADHDISLIWVCSSNKLQ